jgi:TolB-like protein
VNIAARLEALADPGGIVVSRPVHTQVSGKLDLGFQPLGPQRLKNIEQPVEVWRVDAAGSRSRSRAASLAPPRRSVLAAMAAIVLLVLAGASAWWWTSDAGQGSPSGKPTIAVVPFANLSGETRWERLADGISEDIITDLARRPELLVIARNSTFTYKGKAVDMKQVGRELGARFVPEGSNQAQGEWIRGDLELYG